MTPEHWLSVLARITPDAPIDLDEGKHSSVPPGAALAAEASCISSPSARLWEREETGASYLGIRVDRRVSDPQRAALRLAAAALERGVTPIILASLDQSGFERFGFRIERFLDGPDADRVAWEAEMTAFWELALIIDIGDVAALG